MFIDETWTATNMTRSHGRCAKGERLRMGLPHGHRKTTTLVAGLRMTGMVAPMVLDGPINGDWFEAYVTQVLIPELRPGDVVIIMAYAFFSEEEAKTYKPTVVMVDEKNKVREIRTVEYHGQTH